MVADLNLHRLGYETAQFFAIFDSSDEHRVFAVAIQTQRENLSLN
jgi:hypothetical protein